MEAKNLIFGIAAQHAARVRAEQARDGAMNMCAPPSLPEMLARARRLSNLIGALCQVFDEGVLPNTKRTLAECEELAFALRSDLERMAR